MEEVIITDGIKFMPIKREKIKEITLRSAKTVIVINGLLQLAYTGKRDADKEKIHSLLLTENAQNLFEYAVK